MDQIQWEHFPEIAVHHQARTWLLRESQIGLAPNTLKAYGQAMNDFLAFWVAAVDAMRIGNFAGTRDPRAYGPDFGKSLMLRSKYQLLASLRRFFRDLQDFPYNLPRSLSR